MWYRIGADLVVWIHLVFVLFVLTGSLLALKWRWLVWVHLPAAAWGAIVEFTGWICPLTPLEQTLRSMSGGSAYRSDFIGHYILPLLYPAALTRNTQILLGMMVVLVNAVVYWWISVESAKGQRKGLL
jgi:hypothetical protein